MTPQDIYDFHQWFNQLFTPRLGKRAGTMYQALLLAIARNAQTYVETGTARENGNWVGDGQSTIVFGAFAQRYRTHLWTCDLNPAAIESSQRATNGLHPNISFHTGDSLEFLRNFDRPIDFLYLDSFDFGLNPGDDPNPPQDHALKEYQAARPRLHTNSIILVDDCALQHGGKGGKVIPYMLGEGWRVIGMGYQVLLTLGIANPGT